LSEDLHSLKTRLVQEARNQTDSFEEP
jgi:hypothetical protein